MTRSAPAARAGRGDPPAGRPSPHGAAAGAVVDLVRTAPDVVVPDVVVPDVVVPDAVHDLGTAGTAGTAGTSTAPEHVWYVSYGSNLLRERFEVYLLGGSVAGLSRRYPGGAGTSRATGERALVLPGRLRFALDAPSWGGGGVAFWDPAAAGPGVLARAWRVRLRQFLEVVHLENGGLDRRASPWPADVLDRGEARVGDGWYSRLLRAGDLDGEPALTFTHPAAATLATRAPSDAYAGVVGRGLVETFGAPGRGALAPEQARGYLLDALAS